VVDHLKAFVHGSLENLTVPEVSSHFYHSLHSKREFWRSLHPQH
jgi:hypothetical protein